MKLHIYIAAALSAATLSGCNDWLEQENINSMTDQQTYSQEAGINSIASNLYASIPAWQEFQNLNDHSGGWRYGYYDICRFDEALNNSAYWDYSGNVGSTYRDCYNYGLIRNINLHIRNIETIAKGKITEPIRRYYLAEGRWLRAWVYFRMAVQYGGVPLVKEVTQYTEHPASLAVPRNTEAEVYDFVISEMDAIADDFGSSRVRTRATRGGAMALKCRAALYAGTLAYNHDVSQALGLNLPSGATGIPADRAAAYFQQCLQALDDLSTNGYSLYSASSNLADNYAQLFLEVPESNPEVILAHEYDGKNLVNDFTNQAMPRSITAADRNKTSSIVNPALNLLDCYEIVNGHRMEPLKAYQGEDVLESMSSNSSSLKYVIYDNAADIFAGRDPRLAGTVLYPGSSFRGKPVDLQAGIAEKTANGSYKFHSATTIAGLSGLFKGLKMTGEDGPLCSGPGNNYISHTGTLLRKMVDTTDGSELQGNSKVPYILFRYGEALLNGAEAAFYLNALGVANFDGRSTLSLALDCINQIRRRAGGDAFTINASELSLDRIRNERRVELAFEDHRYEDLKRWRTAHVVWSNDPESFSSAATVLWPYRIYAPGQPEDGKWLYRKMRAVHRANQATFYFTTPSYYNFYPQTEGNLLTEQNPLY